MAAQASGPRCPARCRALHTVPCHAEGPLPRLVTHVRLPAWAFSVACITCPESRCPRLSLPLPCPTLLQILNHMFGWVDPLTCAYAVNAGEGPCCAVRLRACSCRCCCRTCCRVCVSTAAACLPAACLSVASIATPPHRDCVPPSLPLPHPPACSGGRRLLALRHLHGARDLRVSQDPLPHRAQGGRLSGPAPPAGGGPSSPRNERACLPRRPARSLGACLVQHAAHVGPCGNCGLRAPAPITRDPCAAVAQFFLHLCIPSPLPLCPSARLQLISS